MNKFWTEKNRELLRKSYSTGGWPAAREIFPDQSKMAIVQAARALGLTAPSSVAKSASPKLSKEQRLNAQIAAKKAEIARLAARRDGIAAEEARRAVEREQRVRNRATGSLELRHAKLVKRAEELRATIVAIKPDYAGARIGSPQQITPETAIEVPTGALKAQTDRGDMDVIRKRMANFVIPQLVRDLRVTGPGVIAAIESLIASELTPEARAKAAKRTDLAAKAATA